MGRKLTLLLVPHTSRLRPWRLNFSLSFLAFLFMLWSGLTLWAGWMAGRNLDYWVTKADNEVMRRKVSYFAEEFDRSRERLTLAKDTDERMRTLLGMRTRRAIIEEAAVGGPDASERGDLGRALALSQGAEISQPEIRRQAVDIRQEADSRLESFKEIAWYIASQRSLYRATPGIWPAPGRITSSFGYRLSPFQSGDPGESGEFHHGLDIANAPETPIAATADGVVRYAGWQSGYGRIVLVDHGFGFSTLYAHTSRISVKPQQAVKRGDVIAFMGTTGRSTGEHLHYEVWRFGKPVNPLAYLRGAPAAVARRDSADPAASMAAADAPGYPFHSWMSRE